MELKDQHPSFQHVFPMLRLQSKAGHRDGETRPATFEDRPMTPPKAAWDRVLTKSGVTDASLHALRHTFASQVVASVESLYTLSKMLGSDLAIAHVLAMKRLLDGGSGGALNLGTGQGLTVRQVLAAVERQAGRPLAVQTVDRRAGDVPVLVADARRAFETLGWTPALSFDDVVQTAWRWHASEIARTA